MVPEHTVESTFQYSWSQQHVHSSGLLELEERAPCVVQFLVLAAFEALLGPLWAAQSKMRWGFPGDTW